MKRVLSFILIFCICFMHGTFLLAADDQSQTATVVYQQWNNGSLQLASQSPAHYGDLNSGNTLWPINFIGQLTSISSGTFYPDSITIEVSNDIIRHGSCTVYVGVYNAWATFVGSTDYNTLFEWVPSVPGYRFKGSASTTLGFGQTGNISANTPSNVVVPVRRQASGASGGSDLGNATIIASRTPNQHYVTHEASNGNSSQPSWVVASNSYNIMKINITTASEERDTVRFTLDANDITSVTSTLSQSGTHLISGVFVPISLVVDTSNYSASMLDMLDSIVEQLADLNLTASSIDAGISDVNTGISGLNTTLSTGITSIINLLNTNFASIIASIGTSTGNRDNILFYLTSLLSQVSRIVQGLEHYGGDNPSNSYSAVQYIEYYLRRVLEDTAVFVEYIENITNTVEDMADQIDDTNVAIDELNSDSEDIHEQEQELFDDANDAIGNLAISDFDFDFDGWTGQGVRAAGTLFESLWESIGPYAQLYSFALMLTVTMTILRYSTRRPKERQNNNRGNKDNSNG